MNRLELKGNENEIKGKLKQKYGDLTDELLLVEGRDNEMLGRVQMRLGKTEAEVRRKFESL